MRLILHLRCLVSSFRYLITTLYDASEAMDWCCGGLAHFLVTVFPCNIIHIRFVLSASHPWWSLIEDLDLTDSDIFLKRWGWCSYLLLLYPFQPHALYLTWWNSLSSFYYHFQLETLVSTHHQPICRRPLSVYLLGSRLRISAQSNPSWSKLSDVFKRWLKHRSLQSARGKPTAFDSVICFHPSSPLIALIIPAGIRGPCLRSHFRSSRLVLQFDSRMGLCPAHVIWSLMLAEREAQERTSRIACYQCLIHGYWWWLWMMW